MHNNVVCSKFQPFEMRLHHFRIKLLENHRVLAIRLD